MLKRAALLMLVCGLLFGLNVGAQTFPAKPVRLVCGGPPGSGPDILARMLAQKLSEIWKQPVVVENRAGAMGRIGAQHVATSPADGYTLLVDTVAFTISASLYRDAGFDPLKDLVGVSRIAEVPLVLVVNPTSGSTTVHDLVTQIRSRKTRGHYASPGSGSLQHLVTEQFLRATGTELDHVPYKGGGQAVLSVLTGETVLFFSGLPPALPFVKSGKLTAIAVTTKNRFPSMPNVPTMAEAGLVGFEADNWHGVMVATDTPRAVIDLLNSGINAAVRNADLATRFLEAGAIASGSTAPAFQQLVRDEAKRWGILVNELKLKVD